MLGQYLYVPEGCVTQLLRVIHQTASLHHRLWILCYNTDVYIGILLFDPPITHKSRALFHKIGCKFKTYFMKQGSGVVKSNLAEMFSHQFSKILIFMLWNCSLANFSITDFLHF